MKKINHSRQKTPAKSRYFFSFPMFTFHSLVQLLLPTVKLNGVSQLNSIEYKLEIGVSGHEIGRS